MKVNGFGHRAKDIVIKPAVLEQITHQVKKDSNKKESERVRTLRAGITRIDHKVDVTKTSIIELNEKIERNKNEIQRHTSLIKRRVQNANH